MVDDIRHYTSMAHLIQLRQRLRAIETIKKITHAMRLISISKHTRLKGKLLPVETYTQHLYLLFNRLMIQTPEWKNPIFYPPNERPNRILYIITSSNKGLCGSFNTQIFDLLNRKSLDQSHDPIYYIMIGKQAVEYGKKITGLTILEKRPDLSMHTIDSIATDCANIIMNSQFSHVSVMSNKIKTFFKQAPEETQIIPYAACKQQEHIEYNIEQPFIDILPVVAQQYLKAQLYKLFFESLLAEQAARFLSMDAATRNATTLLEDTTLHYNKMRQLKITKELIELISGL